MNWKLLFRFTASVLIAALLAGPISSRMDAQQQNANMPTGATGAGMLYTTTSTNAAVAVIALQQGKAGTLATDFVTGTHNVFGYYAQGPVNCFVQVFDRFPVTSITLGTTVPLTSLVMDTNSTR